MVNKESMVEVDKEMKERARRKLRNYVHATIFLLGLVVGLVFGVLL